MFNTALHRKIAKQSREVKEAAISHEKEMGTYDQLEVDQTPNNTLLNKISGYEKQYQKQTPVVAGGRTNMEISEPPRSKVVSRRRIPSVGMLYQDQLTNMKGGSHVQSDSEEEEIEETNMKHALGAGLTVSQQTIDADAMHNQMKARVGGSTKRAPEVVEGSVEVEVAVVKPKRGRKPKVVVVENPVKEKPKSPVKGPTMTRRANKIKEIMKSMNKSMIEASKYIKENKISY